MVKFSPQHCSYCQDKFTPTSSKSRHCSHECRFMENATAQNGVDGCWEWPKSINPQTGYGSFMVRIDGKSVLKTAHRMSFTVFRHEIPDGMDVCHTCDNRKCFNPAHLFLGTALDNMRDMLRKGRGGQANPRADGWVHPSIAKPERLTRGAKHYAAKISDATALEIKDLLLQDCKMAEVARRLGVSYRTVTGINYGRSWAHINPTCQQYPLHPR